MNHFPTPIPLNDLVAACGVDGVRDLALACGAIAIAPKPNQAWRCVLEEQVIIGYKTTVVVAGRDELAMAAVAARLRYSADQPGAWDASDDVTARYHIYAMALDVRRIMDRASRAIDMDRFAPIYTELIARLAEMDDVQHTAVCRLLDTYAPDALRAVMLALAVYERGMVDGLDAALPAIDDDDCFLPEAPEPLPPLVSSA